MVIHLITQTFAEMDLVHEPVIEDSIRSFDPEWEPKIQSDWMGRRPEPSPNLQKRVNYLWAKLRVACYQPGLLNELEVQREKYLDSNYGMRKVKMVVESDEEIDIAQSKHKITTLYEEQQVKRLPWYLLSDESTFSKT
jgi:hypothetical protein